MSSAAGTTGGAAVAPRCLRRRCARRALVYELWVTCSAREDATCESWAPMALRVICVGKGKGGSHACVNPNQLHGIYTAKPQPNCNRRHRYNHSWSPRSDNHGHRRRYNHGHNHSHTTATAHTSSNPVAGTVWNACQGSRRVSRTSELLKPAGWSVRACTTHITLSAHTTRQHRGPKHAKRHRHANTTARRTSEDSLLSSGVKYDGGTCGSGTSSRRNCGGTWYFFRAFRARSASGSRSCGPSPPFFALAAARCLGETRTRMRVELARPFRFDEAAAREGLACAAPMLSSLPLPWPLPWPLPLLVSLSMSRLPRRRARGSEALRAATAAATPWAAARPRFRRLGLGAVAIGRRLDEPLRSRRGRRAGGLWSSPSSTPLRFPSPSAPLPRGCGAGATSASSAAT